MDEQQMNEDLLCDADRELIASAARLQKYVEAPVPAGLLGELSDDLLKLAFIPYASRSKLSSLYGPGLDFMSLVSADWREAFSQGALRMHNAKTISFPTHIEMANGEAVELSISENAQEGGPAWFLSYVPIVEHMKLRRDCVAEAKAESEKPRLPKEPLPTLMEDGFAGMQESEDYLVNPVPLAVLNELDSMDAEFSSFVWVSPREHRARRRRNARRGFHQTRSRGGKAGRTAVACLLRGQLRSAKGARWPRAFRLGLPGEFRRYDRKPCRDGAR
ncbi:MAG: hypothetical protein Q3X49_00535 [Slackia sp.]|uniref:hypothetical protein n=1 Tax=Slackia sp. TaxID=2049041 RepID=UPI0028521BE9|nr:hypothetical protein [Slackia sp.]MDR3899584.1 hypothetical protein [Slackia sp.]